jgi:predicted nucleic acid-binding protein
MQKKLDFVLDCSITLSWCFEDEKTHYAQSILYAMEKSRAIVPALWSIEVANVLTLAQRRKRISHTQAIAFREYLSMLAIEVDDYLLRKPVEILSDLATETGLTAYDATYLELALRKNLPLATLDGQLKQAAKQSGIPSYSPKK